MARFSELDPVVGADGRMITAVIPQLTLPKATSPLRVQSQQPQQGIRPEILQLGEETTEQPQPGIRPEILQLGEDPAPLVSTPPPGIRPEILQLGEEAPLAPMAPAAPITTVTPAPTGPVSDPGFLQKSVDAWKVGWSNYLANKLRGASVLPGVRDEWLMKKADQLDTLIDPETVQRVNELTGSQMKMDDFWGIVKQLPSIGWYGMIQNSPQMFDAYIAFKVGGSLGGSIGGVAGPKGKVIGALLGGHAAGVASAALTEAGAFKQEQVQALRAAGIDEQTANMLADKYARMYGPAAGVVEYGSNIFQLLKVSKGMRKSAIDTLKKTPIWKLMLDPLTGGLSEGGEELSQGWLSQQAANMMWDEADSITGQKLARPGPQSLLPGGISGFAIGTMMGAMGLPVSIASKSAQTRQAAEEKAKDAVQYKTDLRANLVNTLGVPAEVVDQSGVIDELTAATDETHRSQILSDFAEKNLAGVVEPAPVEVDVAPKPAEVVLPAVTAEEAAQIPPKPTITEAKQPVPAPAATLVESVAAQKPEIAPEAGGKAVEAPAPAKAAIMTADEYRKQTAAANKQVESAKQGEADSISKILDEYDSGEGKIQSAKDVADAVENLDNVTPKALDAVNKYREAVREDREELGMRGDVDQYEGALIDALKPVVAPAKAAVEPTKAKVDYSVKPKEIENINRGDKVTWIDPISGKTQTGKYVGKSSISFSYRTVDVQVDASGGRSWSVEVDPKSLTKPPAKPTAEVKPTIKPISPPPTTIKSETGKGLGQLPTEVGAAGALTYEVRYKTKEGNKGKTWIEAKDAQTASNEAQKMFNAEGTGETVTLAIKSKTDMAGIKHVPVLSKLDQLKAKMRPPEQPKVESIEADAQRIADQTQAEANKQAKGGYVEAPNVVKDLATRAMESFFGHFRAFGRQYVSDRPLMHRFEKAFFERNAGMNKGIMDVHKAMKEAGPRKTADSLAATFALEEAGAGREVMPQSASVKKLFDVAKKVRSEITKLEMQTGVLRGEFPEGARDRIGQKMDELKSKDFQTPGERKQIATLEQDLKDLEKFAAYMPHTVVARRVMQKIFEESRSGRRRDIAEKLEQFHHQRKGRGTLREYVKAGIITPEDADVGRLLMGMAADANRKIATKSLVDYGKQNDYIVIGKEPPGDSRNWYKWSDLAPAARVWRVDAPKGEEVYVHRLFGLGLEELSGANRPHNTVFDNMLSIAKTAAFYKPTIIWSYNVQQRTYGGAIEHNPIKNIRNLQDSWKAALTKNADYQEADRLGIFQPPENMPRQSSEATMDMMARQTQTDVWKSQWGDQARKIVERATGQSLDLKKWKARGLKSVMDAIMLPVRATANATWSGDQVQRMHTWFNLKGQGYNAVDAARRTADIHGAYSKIGPGYKAWARKVFFVHSFRLLMPIQTLRAYTTPVKLAIRALSGKKVSSAEAVNAAKSLIGNILFPTALDTAIRALGWEPTEEEEEVFKRKPLKWTRIPIGDGKYQVTLALPNWKYKKKFMRNGQEREAVVGINNIANMVTKWISRLREKPQTVDPSFKELPFYSLAKWEVNPMYRVAIDVMENESSFGESPPRGIDGRDWKNAIGYGLGNIFRLYGDTFKVAQDRPGVDVYAKRQRAELKEALNFWDKMIVGTYGYAYTRKTTLERVDYMVRQLQSNIKKAQRNARQHYEGERLQSELSSLEELYNENISKIKKRYSIK